MELSCLKPSSVSPTLPLSPHCFWKPCVPSWFGLCLSSCAICCEISPQCVYSSYSELNCIQTEWTSLSLLCLCTYFSFVWNVLFPPSRLISTGSSDFICLYLWEAFADHTGLCAWNFCSVMYWSHCFLIYSFLCVSPYWLLIWGKMVTECWCISKS